MTDRHDNPRLHIGTTHDHDSTVVRLAGELDMAEVDRVRRAVCEVLSAHARVDIDLGELTFLDLPGLRLLVELTSTAAADGRQLVLHDARGAVARLLDMTSARELVAFGPY